MIVARHWRWTWFLVMAILLGCPEASRTPRTRPAAGLPGDAGGGVSDVGLPVPEDPVEVLTRFAPVLPVRIRAVAAFPAEALRRAVRDVAAAIAYPLVLETPEAITARIKALYGFDVSRPGPWCVFAWLEADGPALVCEGMGPGEVLERPSGAVGWNAWQFQGHRVARADVIAAAGEGFLAIGSEPAVRRIAMVRGGAWPSLQSGMSRLQADIRRAGRAGDDEEAALWFADPAAAPWCLAGICEATAVFASRNGLRVTAEAKSGLGSVLRSSIEVAWETRVVRPFGARPLPDAVSKPADLLIRQAVVELREPLVTLRAASGDPVFLAAALHPDLVVRFLGPPE